MSQKFTPGGSANTFYGALAYVDVFAPSVIIFENSDALLDGDQTKLNKMLSELTSRGYEVKTALRDSLECGVPCARRHLYIMAMLVCRAFYA